MNNNSFTKGLPRQLLSFSLKNKEWRKKNVDWGADRTYFNYAPVRNSIRHKMINYNLLLGKLTMSDLVKTLNPDNIEANYIPEDIIHYPIMNSKLDVLRGEEYKRLFDFKVVVTNPTSISEIEENKKKELIQRIKELMAESSISEDEFNQKLEKINDYYTYEWQDFREIRANALINHYTKEFNTQLMFNEGFMDGLAVGEEIYQCDIVSGEPTLEKINPNKIRVFQSGFSTKIEDADVIVLEDYWSPGRIIDTYYDQLTKKDIEYIENVCSAGGNSEVDERDGFVNRNMLSDTITSNFFFNADGLFGEDIINDNLSPFDVNGNVRVTRVYWKSKRKILKVKSYDPITGEEQYNFFPENYIVKKELGEESQSFWINEAWEGTLIGDKKDGIYVNMRPRVIQYNRLSNPSRCHFGIIGSIYSLNGNKPFSLVDRMKNYNYLYDAIHDRLNKVLASNWGSILEVDLAKIPKGWEIEKWMYYAKINHLAVVDSFKEGAVGAATGKLAGGLNNASRGILETNIGNYIQQQINLLEFIKIEMAEVAGISKQREGQISNRETVGGVERATVQSSHITEWLFAVHDDVKRRVLECLLETAKIALRGKSKKFKYILPDYSTIMVEIDGDEFAESDYGLLLDNGTGIQELQSKLETLAQAALQNQTLSFSTITKLYGSHSLAEKIRLIERDERAIQERQAQAQQQQLQQQQAIAEMQQQQAMAELEQKDLLNQRDNETKILVATISAQAGANDLENDGIAPEEYSQEAKDKLMENIRQFDARLKLDKERLEFDKEKAKTDASLKREALKKKPASASKK